MRAYLLRALAQPPPSCRCDKYREAAAPVSPRSGLERASYAPADQESRSPSQSMILFRTPISALLSFGACFIDHLALHSSRERGLIRPANQDQDRRKDSPRRLVSGSPPAPCLSISHLFSPGGVSPSARDAAGRPRVSPRVSRLFSSVFISLEGARALIEFG